MGLMTELTMESLVRSCYDARDDAYEIVEVKNESDSLFRCCIEAVEATSFCRYPKVDYHTDPLFRGCIEQSNWDNR